MMKQKQKFKQYIEYQCCSWVTRNLYLQPNKMQPNSSLQCSKVAANITLSESKRCKKRQHTFFLQTTYFLPPNNSLNSKKHCLRSRRCKNEWKWGDGHQTTSCHLQLTMFHLLKLISHWAERRKNEWKWLGRCFQRNL